MNPKTIEMAGENSRAQIVNIEGSPGSEAVKQKHYVFKCKFNNACNVIFDSYDRNMHKTI